MAILFRYVFLPVFFLCTGKVLLAQNDVPSPPLLQESMRENPDLAFKQIRRTLQGALADSDHYQAAVCYGQLGDLYYFQAAYLQALDNFYRAESLLRKQEKLPELAAIWIKIGETKLHNRQYPSSLEAFEQGLALYKSVDAVEGIADALAHIGQVHEKNGNLEEAKRYQQLALGQLGEKSDWALSAKIHENIGSIYEDIFQLDSARLYFSKALEIAQKTQDKTLHIRITNNMGDIHRKTGEYNDALAYTRNAASLAKKTNEHYQLASAYRDLSKIFSLTGQYDSAYHYSEAGRNIHTEIFSEDNAKQLTILQTLFELEQKEDAITQYERERRIHFTMLLFGIAIVLLLLFLGLSIISRQRSKIANERKLNEQNQKLHETQKIAMETDLYNKQLKAENLRNELELKSKELTSHTLHLIQKNQLLEELKEKLGEIVNNDKRDQRKELKQLLNLLQLNHNQDKNWEDFRVVFERVHEHFFEGLMAHCSKLSSADLRLAALLKMNLRSADIATMLGISQDSLRIARYRLRKKLDLPEGESLSTFIQKL
ncbi:tetratricopeptide repeat protein [Sphingobacterium phlebotomi]|uniref:Tetratricopeptide repeat protein n=1 Tax=Sphingobacterium phlebotomi TaxID=2605433 RepID=A0A5D4H7Y2_9SPHI|nr:tetratricopeptide repeat protein [Sphingobacterium phlebotomi]TYR35555.1 tetratricopeptide repeat protein [Sphingobacterium phlebotomi]